MKSTLVSIGILSALVIACNPLMGWEDPYTLEAKADLSEEDAGGGDAGTQVETDAANTAPGADAGTSGCLVDNDCASWFDKVKPSPATCAEAYCEGGLCRARPVDADGDGHRVAKCEIPGVAFTKGDDCDDADKDFYPDKTRECSELPDGTKITYPTTPPTGSCKRGTQACKSDGTIGACTNAVAPKAKDTCVAGNDDTCDGTPNKDCPCTLGGAPKSCGACGTGTQTCADPGTGPVWGTCQNGQPSNYGQSCGSCGGTIKCDGTCSVATPANYNQNCGSCGGKITCGGTCSVATPANYGSGCGSCGGSITCNGSCSVGTPANYNQNCGSCGGKITCGGTCSVATPGNLGTSCNSSCGSVQCSGACSNTTPNVGGSCNSGCGIVGCTGSCSTNVSNVNVPCANGCGTKTCAGTCSNSLGSVSSHSTWNSNFSCCWINQTKTFGGACSSGFQMYDCYISNKSGGGNVYVESTGSGGSCTCTVREQNVGTEGATYTVNIRQRAVCSSFIP